MTTTQIPVEAPQVAVDGECVVLRELTVDHGEAAAIVRAQLEKGGPTAAAELIRRALPVGLVALSMGSAAVDTGAITRTLDSFAEQLDARSKQALEGLDQAVTRLQAGEQAVAQAATGALAQLPGQVEAALAGEAATVRTAVGEATRAVQAAGLQELRAALAQHSEAMRNVLSLDREGPVQALRRDLHEQLDGTRRELTEQLTQVRGLLQAAQAHKTAAAKSSRAVGQEWEAQATAIADEVITAAGDRFEATGSRPAPGGTARTGDGVAVISTAITGHGRTVRIVVEAKKRSRPLTAKQLRDEATTARQVREATASLTLVPTAAEVPGQGSFARVDDLAFVVAADEPSTVSLVYLVLREMTALLTIRQDDGTEVNLGQLEAQIGIALTALEEFQEVGRLALQAQRSLESLRAVGGRVHEKIHQALTSGLSILHP